MDQITEEDFKKAEKEKEELIGFEKEENIGTLLEEMDDPVLAQKKLAIIVKKSIDIRITKEMQEHGYLSETTRKWIDTYNSILEKIQKALHGDKHINLSFVKISHSDIAAKIRENKK